MITILQFNSIFQMVLFYLALFVIVGIPAFYFYVKAVKSRKYYKCPNCGEIYRTEHMISTCCKICGSPVVETSEKNVTDKTF